MSEQITGFDEWLAFGIDRKWCLYPTCYIHDGLPTSDEEEEDVNFKLDSYIYDFDKDSVQIALGDINFLEYYSKNEVLEQNLENTFDASLVTQDILYYGKEEEAFNSCEDSIDDQLGKMTVSANNEDKLNESDLEFDMSKVMKNSLKQKNSKSTDKSFK